MPTSFMRLVRHGHAVFDAKATRAFFKMSIEATLLGTITAFMWRASHAAEKKKYDRYYSALKTEGDNE